MEIQIISPDFAITNAVPKHPKINDLNTYSLSLSEGWISLSFWSFSDDFNAVIVENHCSGVHKTQTLAASLMSILRQWPERSLKPWSFTCPLLSVHFMRSRRKTNYLLQVILPTAFSPMLLLSHFSRVRLCVTPWTAAHQAPRPWDSPGKNTGVGCHFLLQRVKVKSEREVTQSCLTLSSPMDCSPPGSSIHGIFPGEQFI